MIGQKTLHSFFSAAPAKKRGRSPEPGGEAEVATGGLAALEGERGLGGVGVAVEGGEVAVEGGVLRRWWPLGRAALAAVGGGGGGHRETRRPAATCKNPALPARLTDLPIEATLRRRPMGAEGRRRVTVARLSGSPPALASQ